MLFPSCEIIVGLLMLVAGGELLLRGAVGLATLARVTPAVIGLTVVAAGTSVPELAVSAIAAARGNTDITVANIVGSNIFNITLILGLAASIRPLAITGNTIGLEYPVLALVSLLYVVVSHDGSISRLDAILFLAIYVGFTWYLVALVRKQLNAQERQALGAEVKELAEPVRKGPRMGITLALVAGGIMLLIFGANATVVGAVQLGRIWGLSERVIGLTIISGGTGLPEVVTSLVSSYRGRDDVAIGNVIGSNLFNILGTLGLTGAIATVPVPHAMIVSDNWWMLGITLLLFPLIFTGRRIVRWEGVLLLATYGTYLTILLARPALPL
jgi:cation:H+ antiporter